MMAITFTSSTGKQAPWTWLFWLLPDDLNTKQTFQIVGYVKNVFSGNYDIYIDENKVGSYNGTGFFGELALMYNVPRAATIKASSEGLLWSLVSKIIY